jgi:hypothetical protein
MHLSPIAPQRIELLHAAPILNSSLALDRFSAKDLG